MDKVTHPFRVNIWRPQTKEENQAIIEWVEPLREQGRVLINAAYGYNRNLHDNGEYPTIGQMKYMFWFNNQEDAAAMLDRFPHPSGERVELVLY